MCNYEPSLHLHSPVHLLGAPFNRHINQSHGSYSMHADKVRKTCWSSNQVLKSGRKRICVTMNVTGLLVPDSLVWIYQKPLIYYSPQPSLRVTINERKKRTVSKQQLCGQKMSCGCKTSLDRVVQDDKKAIGTAIKTCWTRVRVAQPLFMGLVPAGFYNSYSTQFIPFTLKYNIKKLHFYCINICSK